MVTRPVPAIPRAILAAVLVVPVLVGLILIVFVWPSARIAPRDLPLGAAGPAADQIADRLEAVGGDAFDVHTYADEAGAREAVQQREIYGAIVVGPGGVRVLTASAASPVVAQQLVQTVSAVLVGNGAGVGGGGGGGSGGGGAAAPVGVAAVPGLTVVDLVPAPASDPRGAALGSAVLPLVLAGMVVGMALTSVSGPGPVQLGALVAASGLVGVIATAIAHSWLGVVTGAWWGVAGVFALMVLAISAAVAGLRGLLGMRGVGVAAALVVVLGNSWSGFSSAPELLPGWVSTIGGLLPPGAGGQLLRDVAFFHGHAGLGPAFVLFGWFVLGAAGVLAASLRDMRSARPDGWDKWDGADGSERDDEWAGGPANLATRRVRSLAALQEELDEPQEKLAQLAQMDGAAARIRAM